MNSQPNIVTDALSQPVGFELPAARFEIKAFARASDIEAEWRHLESSGVGTVFQRFDWVDAYIQHVLLHEKASPVIVLGRLGGVPAFILPLAVKTIGLVRVATWIGGKHSSYNFGLWSHEAAAAVAGMERAEIEKLLRAAIPGVDCALLGRMPTSHDGVAQPLAALMHRPSPTEGYSFSLANGFASVLERSTRSACRRKLKAKQRGMSEAGVLQSGTVRDAAHAETALDFFADQKALRLAEQGRSNSFAAPGVMDFFRELLKRSRTMAEPLLELAELSVGGKTRAVAGCAPYRGRMNVYFITFAKDELAPFSPGLLLTHRHVEECCERGMTAYDLGVGREDFKSRWCDVVHELQDSYLPLSPLGTATVAAIRLGRATMDRVRRNPALWRHLRSAKDTLSRRVPSSTE
jgi:CelD/BcsL family acetyltransferase involved in cellulose biosynthesis